MKLNQAKNYAFIQGNHPVVYVQGGNGFDGAGNFLGASDPAGNLAGPAARDMDREALEQEAADLGVTFRSNVSDETLRQRISDRKVELAKEAEALLGQLKAKADELGLPYDDDTTAEEFQAMVDEAEAGGNAA